MIKNKIITAVLTATIFMTLGMPAFATPNTEVIENQQKYDELTSKIDELTGKVVALNAEIEPLVETLENNKKQLEDIKLEIDNTEKEIKVAEEDIEGTEKVLGKRIRELYKSGGQSSYLMLLFSADSFNDLIAKIDITNRLVSIDKKVVNDLKDKQQSLDEKKATLDQKSQEIVKINEETEVTLAEFEVKKSEQEKLVVEAQQEQEVFEREFLAVSERTLVQAQFTVIESSASSKSDLQSAISQLRSIRDNQIKSQIVIDEINEYIESAKVKVEALEQAEAEAEAEANRGDISATGNAIVDEAYRHLGKYYVWGATGPDVFDCSGFTSYVYRQAAGIEITRTTYTQMGVGTPVAYSDLQVGDLVFTYGGDHVGIYVGGGSYIHASRPGDVVKVSPVMSFYTARRIL